MLLSKFLHQILGFLCFYFILFFSKFLLKNSDQVLTELQENEHIDP